MERRDVDVCVVGAGFAGLAAARYVVNAKKTVAVLEARDRVGGRVWNKTLKDGTVVSAGGTWLGKGNDRLQALVTEVNLETYPQYVGRAKPDPNDPLKLCDEADQILRLDGVNKRYKGMLFPLSIGALVSSGLALEELNGIAKTVCIDKPWETPDAHKLDSQTLGAWIDSSWHVPSDTAKEMFRAALGLFFCGDLSMVSLLGSMVLARGGGEDYFNYYMDSTITEQDLVDGGTPEVARRLGEKLGDALRKSTPVRRVKWADDHVEVFGDDIVVRAKRVIITAPPVVAAQIEYDPPLPAAYGQLMRQMPAGVILRGLAVYDRPFWRDMGLTGQSIAPQSPVIVTIDQCPRTPPGGGQPKGVLSSYAMGAKALELAAMDKAARRALWLNELVERFDGNPAAGNPIDFDETNWSAEQWSQGGMIAHFPPGVLTAYGSVLHQPCGRIAWAGSERATEMHGLMEGAVRSGEKAAKEAVDKL